MIRQINLVIKIENCASKPGIMSERAGIFRKLKKKKIDEYVMRRF